MRQSLIAKGKVFAKMLTLKETFPHIILIIVVFSSMLIFRQMELNKMSEPIQIKQIFLEDLLKTDYRAIVKEIAGHKTLAVYRRAPYSQPEFDFFLGHIFMTGDSCFSTFSGVASLSLVENKLFVYCMENFTELTEGRKNEEQ